MEIQKSCIMPSAGYIL